MNTSNGTSHLLARLLAIVLVVPFWAAAQQRTPDRWNKKELKAAVAGAKTAAEHARIAEYYRLKAAQSETEAKKHSAFAAKYTTRVGRHCRWLAAEYEKKAQKEQTLANVHDQIARAAARKGT